MHRGLRQSPACLQIPRRCHRSRHSSGDLRLLLHIVLQAARQVAGGRLVGLAVQVAVHEDAAALGALRLLDELAGAHVAPEGDPEGGLGVGLVVGAHDLLDVLGGLAGVVEGDGGDEVVADVGADDIVEEMGVDEAQVAVDGGGCATSEGPGLVVVMGHAGIGVLEEGDGDLIFMLVKIP